MYQASFSPLLSTKKEEGPPDCRLLRTQLHTGYLRRVNNTISPYDLKIGLFDLEISGKMKNGESCTIVCSHL